MHYKISGNTQGTTFNITISDIELKVNPNEVDSFLNTFDLELSGYVKGSLLDRFNSSDSIFDLGENVFFTKVFNQSKEVYEQTDGAFDPTVMPLVNYWGFGIKDFDRASFVPDSSVIDSLKSLVNFDNLKIDQNRILKIVPNQSLDFNAIAQGYSVDILSDFIRKKGHTNFLVEIGGEIYAQGNPKKSRSWKVGVDYPSDQSDGSERKLIYKIELDNKGIATSGNYRKFYLKDGVKYAHTIDPKTGFPVQHSLLSVTVISDECSKADAYATAFMVMGKEKVIQFLKDHPNENIDVLLMDSDENGKINTWKSDKMDKYLSN